jgi:glycosyltransferase involved in cell wall biosynthesis
MRSSTSIKCALVDGYAVLILRLETCDATYGLIRRHAVVRTGDVTAHLSRESAQSDRQDHLVLRSALRGGVAQNPSLTSPSKDGSTPSEIGRPAQGDSPIGHVGPAADVLGNGSPPMGLVTLSDVTPSEPRVSVVIPVHNREHLVEGAVRSVLAQTYPDLEVIVVDDGSTDGTAGVLEAVARQDPRVSILTHPTSRGAQAARNSGIRASSGRWVTFLDSDDRYLPDSITLRMEEARRRAVTVVHGEARRVAATGTEPLFGVPRLEGNVRRELLACPGPLFPALLVRRDVLAMIGYLDESIIAWQEWDTAIRLSRVARFGFVPVATFDYDERTPVAISRDARRTARGYEQIVRKHRRHILRELGTRGLAEHYRTMAGLETAAGHRRRALGFRLVSLLIWPSNGARALRRRLLRPR